MLNDATADHSAKQIIFKWQMLKFTANVEVATFPSACRPQQIEGCINPDRHRRRGQCFQEPPVATPRIKQKVKLVLIKIVSGAVDFRFVVIGPEYTSTSLHLVVVQMSLFLRVPIPSKQMFHLTSHVAGKQHGDTVYDRKGKHTPTTK